MTSSHNPDIWTNSRLDCPRCLSKLKRASCLVIPTDKHPLPQHSNQPYKQGPHLFKYQKPSQLIWRLKSLWNLDRWSAIRPLAQTRTCPVSSMASFSNTSFKMNSWRTRIVRQYLITVSPTMAPLWIKKNTLFRRKTKHRFNRQLSPSRPVTMVRLRKPPLWTSQSVLTPIGSTMPRTCVPHAIERTVEASSHGTANIRRGSTTPWVCAKHATCPTTTREETRPKRSWKSKSPYLWSPFLLNRSQTLIKRLTMSSKRKSDNSSFLKSSRICFNLSQFRKS